MQVPTCNRYKAYLACNYITKENLIVKECVGERERERKKERKREKERMGVTFPSAVLGSNPKHTTYASSIYSLLFLYF